MRGELSLIRKDSITHMHGLAVYVKEGLPFARNLFLENSVDSYCVLDWFYFTVFDSISSDIDEVLSINPSANGFVLGDFNVHHKDWLNYSQLSLIQIGIIRTFTNSNEIPWSPQNFLTDSHGKICIIRTSIFRTFTNLKTGLLSEKLFIIQTCCGLNSRKQEF